MPFDQRSQIHWKAWFLGGPKIPKTQLKKKQKKNIPNAKTLKFLEIC